MIVKINYSSGFTSVHIKEIETDILPSLDDVISIQDDKGEVCDTKIIKRVFDFSGDSPFVCIDEVKRI